jgi:multicomponent Na+:H+ antiporter subunit C
MTVVTLYALAGVALFTFGLFALVTRKHLLLKVLAGNVAGSGVFLVFIAIANRGAEGPPDPVPQAMVLTGIVVAVSTTALALNLAVRVKVATGRASFEQGDDDQQERR